jgi:quinohemoprotein ethanol dehydrogenase
VPETPGSPLLSGGMPDFTGELKPEEIEKIKAFIQATVDAIRPK